MIFNSKCLSFFILIFSFYTCSNASTNTSDTTPDKNKAQKTHSRIEFIRHATLVPTTISKADRNYNQGMKFATEGQFDKAKIEFEKAIAIDAAHQQSVYALKSTKEVLEGKRSKKAAIFLFMAMADIDKSSSFDKGLSYLNKAIATDPKFVVAYVNRSMVYKLKGDYVKAMQDLTKAIAIDSKCTDCYYNRATLYSKKGNQESAIKDYSQCINININDADAYYNRGIAFIKTRQMDKAIADFSNAIKYNPKYIKAYFNRGMLYKLKGQYKDAAADLTSVINLDNRNALGYYYRGNVYYLNMKDKVKGCADWKRACELGRCKNYRIGKSKGECK